MVRLGWLAVVLAGSSALAYGPEVVGGATVTLREQASGVTFSHLAGPALRVGFEAGDRFNNELAVQVSQAAGTGRSAGLDVPVDLLTVAGWYTFSFDFFGKEGLRGSGFTPTLGLGLAAGTFRANTAADKSLAKWGPYLELHAVAGARYTLRNGLSLRLEVVGSTYGGFFAVQPSLSAAWRF